MLVTEELIALIERSEAQAVKASVLAAGGDVLEIAGGVAAFAGDGHPMTQVAGVMGDVSDTEFQAILEFYKGRATQFEFKLSPISSLSLRSKVVTAAKSLPEFEALLVHDLSDFQPHLDTVDIRLVDPADATPYARRAVDRFHAGGTPPPGLAEAIAKAAFREGFFAYELFEGDLPVAGCGLGICGSIAWFAGAATAPEFRGRGYHKAMQRFRLGVAKELGCTVAVQAALPGSQSQQNAQKSGFQIAITRPTFYL